MKKYFFIISIVFFGKIALSAQEKEWHITAISQNNYTGIVAANGRIGILPSSKIFKTDKIILNNVYDKESPLGVSKILMGMNFGNFDFYINNEEIKDENISDWQQTINMKEAKITTSFKYKDLAKISYDIYALRNVQYSGYIDFSVQPYKDIKIQVTAKIITPQEFKSPLSTFRVLRDLETTMPILQTVAKSRLEKHTVATSGTFIWHDINSTREHLRPQLTHTKITDLNHQLSFSKELKKDIPYSFAWTAAQCSTQDFMDPQTESERFVIFNLLTPRKDLLSQHKSLWKILIGNSSLGLIMRMVKVYL